MKTFNRKSENGIVVLRRNERSGFSIVEVTIAVGVLMVGVLIFVGFASQIAPVRAQQDRSSQVSALRLYVTTMLNCAKTMAHASTQCAQGKAIDTYTSDGTKISTADGRQAVGKYLLQATCNSNLISFLYKSLSDTNWNDLSNGIPIYCPSTLPSCGGPGFQGFMLSGDGAQRFFMCATVHDDDDCLINPGAWAMRVDGDVKYCYQPDGSLSVDLSHYNIEEFGGMPPPWIDSFKGWVLNNVQAGQVVSETIRNSSIIDPSCNNPNGSKIYVELSEPCTP